jgi:hypothetical protein
VKNWSIIEELDKTTVEELDNHLRDLTSAGELDNSWGA